MVNKYVFSCEFFSINQIIAATRKSLRLKSSEEIDVKQSANCQQATTWLCTVNNKLISKTVTYKKKLEKYGADILCSCPRSYALHCATQTLTVEALTSNGQMEPQMDMLVTPVLGKVHNNFGFSAPFCFPVKRPYGTERKGWKDRSMAVVTVDN